MSSYHPYEGPADFVASRETARLRQAAFQAASSLPDGPEKEATLCGLLGYDVTAARARHIQRARAAAVTIYGTLGLPYPLANASDEQLAHTGVPLVDDPEGLRSTIVDTRPDI